MREEKMEKESDLYNLSLSGRQLGLTLTALILIFCLAFALGYIVGGAGKETLEPRGEEMKELAMTSPEEGRTPLKDKEPREGEATSREELTFYKTLLEEKPPLGIEDRPKGPEEKAGAPPSKSREGKGPEEGKPPAEVEPQAPSSKVVAAAPLPKAEQEERLFTVQVSSLRSPSNAEALRTRLARRGYEAYVEKVNLADKGLFHRVRVGPFKTRAGAQRVARRLKEVENLKEAVVARR